MRLFGRTGTVRCIRSSICAMRAPARFAMTSGTKRTGLLVSRLRWLQGPCRCSRLRPWGHLTLQTFFPGTGLVVVAARRMPELRSPGAFLQTARPILETTEEPANRQAQGQGGKTALAPVAARQALAKLQRKAGGGAMCFPARAPSAKLPPPTKDTESYLFGLNLPV